MHCRFNNIQDLIQHLHMSHQVEMKETNHSFSSFEVFKQRKTDEEIHTKSCYTQKAGSRVRLNSRYWYYYCNRSGEYQTRRAGKRSIKLQGSNKLDNFRTAHMKVTQQQWGNTSGLL